MTGNSARVKDLHELAEIWTRRRLHVLETSDWETWGRSSDITFECLGCHHTAAEVDIDRMLHDGRPGIPGPLCNVALHARCVHGGDRLGDVVLTASGRANHFGVAFWSSSRALGVEATGPPFTNYKAYVQLAAGFCEWKRQPPTKVLRSDTAIDVYLVAAHKEVADPYGRKPNPAGEGFNNQGRTIAGVQLIDGFRQDVAAALAAKEDDMFNDSDRDNLTWLRENETRLRDEAVRMTAMGQPDGPSGREVNNIEEVLRRLDLVAKDVADLKAASTP